MNRTLDSRSRNGSARLNYRSAARHLAGALIVLASLGALANGCASETPGDKYDDFMERADRRPPELSDAEVVGTFVDLDDKEYLMNIRLNLNLDLKLKVLFTDWVANAARTEAQVHGEVRFEAETLDDPPITEFDTVMDSRGRMVISTGKVIVPAARSPIMDVQVEAQLTFVSTAISEDFICGRIEDDESMVLKPIVQSLKGTTFGSIRIVDGVLPMDVPQSCPGQGIGDAGVPGPETGETGSEASAEAGGDASVPSDAGAGDDGGGDT